MGEKKAAEEAAKAEEMGRKEAEAKAAEEAKAAAKLKNEAAEAAAIKKAEEEFKEKLRVETLNQEIEESHRKKQEEANQRFAEAKQKLVDSGAEFVSQEEFAELKAAKANKDTAGAA